MRQSQLITNSPRAFIFLQLHLQKHRTLETFCRFPAPSRSTPANGGLRLGGEAEGLLPARGAGAAWAGSALPAPVPLDREPPVSRRGRRGAGLFIFLLIYVVQKGKACLHLRSATLQRPLMSEFPVAQKQTGRRVPLLPAKANGCLSRWLHSLCVSEDFWPLPASLLIASEVPAP